MEKKGFLGKFKVLSRPTGKAQWKKAIKTMILIVLAILIAKFLGFDAGIKVIIIITLIATIIIDLPLPLRKIIPLAAVGLLMTILAFISSSLALSNLPLFLFFTVVWAFFSLSMYIFGETVGSLGFIIFTSYFLSVLFVNRDASTLDWGFYILLAYLVASLLFVPKIWKRRKDLLNMVSSPFIPETSLERVLSIRQALTGNPLDNRDYELFRIGIYLSGFRGYSKLILSRLSGDSQDIFQSFIDAVNKTSSQIAASIVNKPKPIELELLDLKVVDIQKNTNLTESTRKSLLDVAQDVRSLLTQANDLLAREYPSQKKVKISSSRNSLKEVIRANFNLNNMYIRHALRFTLAMTIGLLVVYLTHERDAIWVTMGILIIIKPDVTSTINNMIVRVSFNVVAILLAIALGFIFPHEILLAIALLMLFLFRAFYPTYMGLSVMVLTVLIVLIWPTGTVFENAVARLIDISIGAIIAFICAYVILPSRLTVNLPEQIAKTIRTNSEYANIIIPSKGHEYNHDKAVKSFRKYMLEEKNLESAIKKVQDSFDDVSDDVDIYNQIKATNRKLAADLSALAILIEKRKAHSDISMVKEEIVTALNELAFSTHKDVILPKVRFNKLESYRDDSLPENIFNYLKWVISDIRFIQEAVNQASRTGALKKYRKMT